ncbi:hypothetical protein LCGC14_0343360 [marine sediment metagenome]|uniref:Band 7 domain-containing protein n=1 Tax=marine sediment metagenome TaxID=412755 RepID=A0A0F9WKW4_9ZZZZ
MGFWARMFELVSQLKWAESTHHNEAAVRLRFGRYTATLEPGLHWRVPFVHTIITCVKKENTVYLPTQVINGTAFAAVFRYEVEDAFLALLETEDYNESITSFAMGQLGDRMLIADDVSTVEMMNDISEDVRLEAKGWGLHLIELKLATYTDARAFRLLGDG